MSTSTTPKPTAPANANAPKNGGSDGKPELTAAERLAALRAAADQAAQELAAQTAEIQALEDAENARVRAEAMAEVSKLADALKTAADAGNIPDALAAVKTALAKVTEVAKANNVKTGGRTTGTSRRSNGGYYGRAKSFFEANPGISFTNREVIDGINAESTGGAVPNQIHILAADGVVVKTSDSPERHMLAPANTTVVSPEGEHTPTNK